MSSFDLGDVVPLGITTYNDASGDPEDAASVSLVVTKPDGTTATPTLTHVTDSGVWTVNYTTTVAGRHRYAFTVTGTATVSGGVDTGTFDVWPADPRFIVDVSEARAALNIPDGVSGNEDELRLYCAAATDYIENLTGPLLTATGQTWTADGGTPAVLLPVPVSAVTGVTVDGTATTSYTVDPVAGIVYAGTGSSAGSTRFASGKANVVVTYTVGASTVPPAAVLAARELITFWWQTSQQGRRRNGNPDEVYFPAKRVEQILAPLMNAVPGMA